jgi:hypothetical protein
MSYTIKSLQKSLTLLQDEFQDLDHVSHHKNHIQDMYLQFKNLAERVSLQQAKEKQLGRMPQPLE